ncbi:sensor histidine kinase [Halapricum hydrolyticum]|uniref:histidine kinase n=1 Tax=Halapricum hydrolyticum TaxID=2979991 RepID=A0AAE3IBV4_9EURY|nr:PAS domain-containing sensor histidine kinase [Halapricum hydrolyticum]MCU4718751.1 PAS domain-containing sensor histidine kinase [Halapricum hydrolyticum]MCU4727738.1 PAS domain-containing sensor histidine kinase [Halapricum hydrolyticum]
MVWAVDIETKEIVSLIGSMPAIENLQDVENLVTFFDRGIHPDDLPEVDPLYRQVFERESEQLSVDFRTHPDQGEIRWIHVDARVMHIEDGDLLVGVGTDITARKRYERELKEQRNRLEEFSSVLSHDLRNPLQIATGHVKLAQVEDKDDHLGAIEQALERMETLISELLTAVEEGGPMIRGGSMVETDREHLDVEAVATAAWDAVETQDATLSVETETTISADRSNLEQLFENLFRNAVEHGGTGVAVTVGDLDEQHGFYVADDGPGIPDGERDAIFEMGYSTGGNGAGLGLRIVSQIAETYGWTVTVTGSERGGARFEIAVETDAG